MKAIVCSSFSSIQNLKWGDFPTPVPAEDEVLIAPAFASVNFPDTLIVQGLYQFKPELPFVPGGEVAGLVVEAGSRVTKFKKGDSVMAAMGWGAFGERTVARESNTFLVPQEVPLEKCAALVETFGTAIHALKDRALLRPGETLVVLGASGGVGNAAVQLGRLFGARVIAVASSEEKRKLALEIGAQLALDGTDLKTQLKELGGADVILDPVGGQLAEAAFRSLNPGGRHLVVGFASGEIPNFPLNLPLLKSSSIVGVFWGHFWRNQTLENRKNVRLLSRWLQEEKISPVISKTYPANEAVKALQDLTTRKAMGKILLKF